MDQHGITGFEQTDLRRRSDDYSEQFSVSEDPKFWIRLEKPLGETLTVSDLLFGAKDEYFMAAAFAQALVMLGLKNPTAIRFQNLGYHDDPATSKVVDRIERFAEAMVARQRRFMVGRDLQVRRDKVDLVIALHNFKES